MAEHPSFRDLIQRLRAGDAAAAEELVQHYGPHIERAIRVRLVDAHLRRRVDTMDIYQSVMASFFVHTALGKYQLDTPDALLRLLVTMARNKIYDQARRYRSQRRDDRGVATGSAVEELATDRDPTPSQQVNLRELLQKARACLSAEEQQLADLRAQGREWADIAAELGGTPEALRKRLERTIERVIRQLGLGESAG
jgi:RNA polymerase sigma-70 factor (ECF subfamily)